MRLKPFIAANMTEAFALVRQELGDDAVIVDTENLPGGKVRLIAALEEEDVFFDDKEQPQSAPRRVDFDDSLIRECLEYHGVIDVVKGKILAQLRNIHKEQGINEDKYLLENSFKRIFRFSSLFNRDRRLKLFMGVPGSGKSTAIAKFAAQGKFNNFKSCIISTDNVRAGANSQLKAFADILEAPFIFAADARKLFEQAEAEVKNYDYVLIDTPGINPFIPAEVEKLSLLTEAVKADMILTMDAGKNQYEAVESADIFCSAGAEYLLPTRMDLTRRVGALLSVAGCTGLSFCSAGVSSKIASGLADVSSGSLAKLVLS